MPFQQIPGLEYGLISFDKDGKERTDDNDGIHGVFSQTLLAKVKAEKPSDVFLFSHGWKGDMPSAIDQYNRWIGAMWKLEADRKRMGDSFNPMFIGLHWPSQPWGDESMGGAVSFASDAEPAPVVDADALFAEAVEQFGDSAEVVGALTILFKQWKENPSAIVVPDESLAAYQTIADAIGFNAGGGPDSPPDEEGAALDPQAAATANRIVEAGAQFGLGSALSGIGAGIKKGILGGLRQLSFWTMKKRARTIGEKGMHDFVKAILAAGDSHVHLMGHSFGCVVVSSILGGPDAKGSFPRKIASVMLAQGAVSLWCWGAKVKTLDKPGYFHNIVKSSCVEGPVLTTRSINDKAVGLAYPAAVALVGQASFDPDPPIEQLPLLGGTGAFGLQGTDVSESLEMLDVSGSYPFKKNRVYNLQGNKFIPSHNGIDGPQVAHAIWEAALVGRS